MHTEHVETVTPARARFFTLIRRDDLMLYNVEIAIAHGICYAPVAPLRRLIGLSPGYARTSLKSTSNTILYGTTTLLPPGYSAKPRLYLRADRMWMYLYRTNTSHMKRRGLVAEARRLLVKQTEWMRMLNCYESHGLAVKPGHAAALRTRLQMPMDAAPAPARPHPGGTRGSPCSDPRGARRPWSARRHPRRPTPAAPSRQRLTLFGDTS